MDITEARLTDTFDHHPPPDDDTIASHHAVRTLCKQFMRDLGQHLPEDRPRELAQIHTDVENVMFHANSAIARSAAQRGRVQKAQEEAAQQV